MFILGRKGIIIDKTKKTVLIWYGLIFPFIRKEYSIEDFDRVSIVKEVRKNKNSSYTVFPVRLASSTGSENLNIEESQDYQESRENAENLAKFLKIPLVDVSSGDEVIRDHDKLDYSLKKIMADSGEKITLPSCPHDMKTIIKNQGSTLILEIPPTGFNLALKLQLVASIIFPAIFFLMFLSPFNSSGINFGGMTLVTGLFLGIPVSIIFYSVLSKAKSTSRITLTRTVLRLEVKRLCKPKPTLSEILLSKLEEITCPSKAFPSAHTMNQNSPQHHLEQNMEQNLPEFILKLLPSMPISARSDDETLDFGHNLSLEEKKYLVALIKKKISE